MVSSSLKGPPFTIDALTFIGYCGKFEKLDAFPKRQFSPYCFLLKTRALSKIYSFLKQCLPNLQFIKTR